MTAVILGKYVNDEYTQCIVPRLWGPLDDNGVPLFDLCHVRSNGPPVYHPVAIFQYALNQYNLALNGNSQAEESFMRCARWVEDNAVEEPNRRFVIWPYTFPLRNPPVPAPWISGMAQGEALSVLARFFQKTGSSKTADVAQKAALSFLYTVNEGGVVTRFSDETCFIEEVAYPPVLHILNGCLAGLLGLFEHVRLFPDRKLQAVLQGCAQGIANLLPTFDTGYWSRYCLWKRGRDLANLHYHRVHIQLLRELGSLLDCPRFLSCADKWEGYEHSKFNRVRHGIVEFLQTNFNRTMTAFSLSANSLKYGKTRPFSSPHHNDHK